MERRELLTYGPAFIDLIDKAPVLDYDDAAQGCVVVYLSRACTVRAVSPITPYEFRKVYNSLIDRWSSMLCRRATPR